MAVLHPIVPAPAKKMPFIISDSSFIRDTMDPDSLYADKKTILTHYSVETEVDAADQILAHCSSYRIFLKRWAEVKRNEKWVNACGLTETARIIEFQTLIGYPHRALILWMYIPRVHVEQDEFYTCPEVTTGKGYFVGITKVSLLDTKEKRIINTVDVLNGDDWESNDTIHRQLCIEVPFSILNPAVARELAGLKYHATGGTDTTEGTAHILYLDDYNGDGKKLEFALYNQEGCLGCSSTLFGYSPNQDKVINYDIRLQVSDFNAHKGIPDTDTTYERLSKWIDHAFCFRFNAKGELNYSMDYRGRGGNWDRYQLKYNKEAECFSGILDTRPQKGDDSVHLSWFTVPERTN